MIKTTLLIASLVIMAGCGEVTQPRQPRQPPPSDEMETKENILIMYHTDPVFCVSDDLKNQLASANFTDILTRVETNHINCGNYNRTNTGVNCKERDLSEEDDYYLEYSTSCVVGANLRYANPQGSQNLGDFAVDANLEIL